MTLLLSTIFHGMWVPLLWEVEPGLWKGFRDPRTEREAIECRFALRQRLFKASRWDPRPSFTKGGICPRHASRSGHLKPRGNWHNYPLTSLSARVPWTRPTTELRHRFTFWSKEDMA